MAEKFGCSSHEECSETLECVHIGEELYSGCSLRKLLDKKKADVEQGQDRELIPVPEKQDKRPSEVYIEASKRLFKVVRKYKNYSYNLSTEEASTISGVFNDNGIPYKNQVSEEECKAYTQAPKDDAPCNSRVVVEINGEEYHILNYDCRLIKEWYAEKLNLAFNSKGFSSRVEIVSAHVTPDVYKYRPSVKKEPVEKVDCEVQPMKEEIIKQVEMEFEPTNHETKHYDMNQILKEFRSGLSIETIALNYWYAQGRTNRELSRREARMEVEQMILWDYQKNIGAIV